MYVMVARDLAKVDHRLLRARLTNLKIPARLNTWVGASYETGGPARS